jgi:hypothetical protein
VIVPPGGVRVLVASRPVDFRKGMDGLAALAKETLAQDPFSGTILVFRAKRADRVKLRIKPLCPSPASQAALSVCLHWRIAYMRVCYPS